MTDNSIYRFNVQKLNGEVISLSDYKDKILLIVNTASQMWIYTPVKRTGRLKK